MPARGHSTPIYAPWNQDQVDALNRWQHYGFVHEFTCRNDHVGNRTLVATLGGWVCPTCGWQQNWAHDFMFEPQEPPFKL